MSANNQTENLKESGSLVSLASSNQSNSLELNRRLQHFEKELADFEHKLFRSHNEFRGSVSSLSKKYELQSNSLKMTQTNLRTLDNSFKSLTNQSEIIANKAASLGTLFEKSHLKQSDNIEHLDSKVTHNSLNTKKELKQLDSNIEILKSNFSQLSTQSENLFSSLNSLKQNTQHTTDEQSKKTQAVEKKFDSILIVLENKIKHNTLTQTRDISQLEKTIVDNEKRSDDELRALNELIEHSSAEHIKKIKKLDNNFKKSQKTISGLGDYLSELSNKLFKQNQETSLALEKNSSKLQSHIKKSDGNNLQFYDKLSDQSKSINDLEKSSEHLRERADLSDTQISKLNNKNSELLDQHKLLESQVIANAKQETKHYKAISSALGLVVVVLLVSFYFTWETMSNGKAELVSQQNIQHANQTTQAIGFETLHAKVSKQESKINLNTINENQSKALIQKLQNNIANVDDQLLYLNQTNGPFSELESGKLEGPSWLKNEDPKNHTIRLKTFDSKIKLLAFVAQEGYYLNQNIALLPIKEKGTTQYSLLYGSFEKESQAKIAMDDLPYQLSDESEGIVSMGFVHSLL